MFKNPLDHHMLYKARVVCYRYRRTVVSGLMSPLPDLETFIRDHRSHGPLTADATR